MADILAYVGTGLTGCGVAGAFFSWATRMALKPLTVQIAGLKSEVQRLADKVDPSEQKITAIETTQKIHDAEISLLRTRQHKMDGEILLVSRIQENCRKCTPARG